MKRTTKAKAKAMTIAEFCDKHGACADGREWALACGSKSMAALWKRDDLKPEWRIWVATRELSLIHI